MNQIQHTLAKTLIDDAPALAEHILTLRFKKYPIKDKQLFDRQSSTDYIMKLVQLLGSSLVLSPSAREDGLKVWAIQTARYALEYGQSLDVAMQSTQFIRSEILQVIERLAEQEQTSVKEVIFIIQEINQMLDLCFQVFTQTYMESILEAI
ncbi:hypothetical protein ABE65_018660 [Fictibacillus phosphorivorans]|uniref:Uncharacterized protein n=1 Tax=Fictibacillus phosphorivorans TaxID=1221500 RepID=A0A161IJM7_9BACL|nr:hypothetical protein [Fictibacillus phosphorivorans]ANC78709.1 hypothetical protein ABE65_018660 [Fictibacillus phosphorivorans]